MEEKKALVTSTSQLLPHFAASTLDFFDDSVLNFCRGVAVGLEKPASIEPAQLRTFKVAAAKMIAFTLKKKITAATDPLLDFVKEVVKAKGSISIESKALGLEKKVDVAQSILLCDTFMRKYTIFLEAQTVTVEVGKDGLSLLWLVAVPQLYHMALQMVPISQWKPSTGFLESDELMARYIPGARQSLGKTEVDKFIPQTACAVGVLAVLIKGWCSFPR